MAPPEPCLGAFSPELMDWAEYEALNEQARANVTIESENIALTSNCINSLRYFGLTGREPVAEFHAAYRRLALQIHPTKIARTDAHVQMVALNAMRDGIDKAYARKILPFQSI